MVSAPTCAVAASIIAAFLFAGPASAGKYAEATCTTTKVTTACAVGQQQKAVVKGYRKCDQAITKAKNELIALCGKASQPSCSCQQMQ